MISTLNHIFLLLSSLLLLLAAVSVIREKATRAALILSMGLILNTGVWLIFIGFGHMQWLRILNAVIIGAIFALAIISILRFSTTRPNRSTENITRFDERDHMFSRNNLKFHAGLSRKYYRQHPEKKAVDLKIHRRPELGHPSQIFYDPWGSPIFDAAFGFLNKIRPFSRGKAVGKKKTAPPAEMTRMIKKIARFYGAVDAGVCRLQPHHLYSHAGRHAEHWGTEVKMKHRFAVVLVVAMNEWMMRRSPAVPVILESSRQYVEAAKIAFVIAEYLRLMGYQATAHTDGNYETLCVPLAIDAGLGELGRLGILVHPRFGPCVRLSVVTTDMELEVDEKISFGLSSFCDICRKCALNCPTKSIAEGKEPGTRGTYHWSINQEKCFAFWKKAGTDCGFCIRVCPFTKPDSIFHRLVRLYVSRNPINRYIALLFDDFLYGKRIPLAKRNPAGFF